MAHEWINNLDEPTRQDLRELVLSTVQHKNNYENAEDPALAQCWLAMVEILRRIRILESRLSRIEERLGLGGEATEEDLKKW